MGPLPFVVQLSESSPDDVELRGEFRVGAGSFQPMTLMGSTRFRTAEDHPVEVTIVWNSRADFAGKVSGDVWVRIAAKDLFDADSEVVLDLDHPIAVDNNTSPSITIELAPRERSFEIPIVYTVQDPEEDRVTVIFQWALDGEPFPELDIPQIPSEEERMALEDLLASSDPDFTSRRRQDQSGRRRMPIPTDTGGTGRRSMDPIQRSPPG